MTADGSTRVLPRLFVTGGSGFVGARLLPRLEHAGYQVVVLDRAGRLSRRFAQSAHVKVVAGDLLAPDTYREALDGTEIVLHLAASTGRASRDEHFRVNATGTETLVNACRRADGKPIVFISSIAATFPDLTGYFYAQAKLAAEDLVRRSGLPFVILRPTMIFGPNAPVQRGLETLARLPIIPVLGSGRVRVQPVHVDDVIDTLLDVLDDRTLFSGVTHDVGGPDVVTIEDLLRRIHQVRRGSNGPVVHIPLWPIVAALRVAESLGLAGLLPLTAGQLSSFRYDGVAGHPFQAARRRRAHDLADMLAEDPVAADSGSAELEAECRVFTRHLVGLAANDYVIDKYVQAHAVLPGVSDGSRFDRWLLRVARTHPLVARIADGYAGLLGQRSLLRRKLVLLIAILETCPPSYRHIDAAAGTGTASTVIRLLVSGSTALASAAAGLLIFIPAKIAFAVIDRRAR